MLRTGSLGLSTSIRRQPLPGQPDLDRLSADKPLTPVSHSASNLPGSCLLDPLLFPICTLNPAVFTSQDIATVYQIFPDEVLGSGQFGVVYGGKDAAGLTRRLPGVGDTMPSLVPVSCSLWVGKLDPRCKDSQPHFPRKRKISGLLDCYQ